MELVTGTQKDLFIPVMIHFLKKILQSMTSNFTRSKTTDQGVFLEILFQFFCYVICKDDLLRPYNAECRWGVAARCGRTADVNEVTYVLLQVMTIITANATCVMPGLNYDTRPGSVIISILEKKEPRLRELIS